MAGIIDEGDIGSFGILRETLQVPLQLGGVAVGDIARVEAEVGQHLGHVAGIVGRVGEGGDVFVFRLADDQRHALEAFRFGGLKRCRGKAKQGGGESCQPRLPDKITL